VRALLLLAVLCSAARSQTLSIEIAEGDLTARLIKVAAEDASVLDLVTQAAARAGVPLRVDPAVLEDLGRRKISVNRERIVLDDLVLLAGTKAGVDVRARDGGLIVEKGPESRTAAVKAALEHADRALLGHPDPQLAPTLRYHRAQLLLETGAAAEAAAAFADLAREFPGHPASAEARVLAVHAALAAGRTTEALGMLAALEDSSDGIPAIPGADLLPARVHLAAGNLEQALVRSRKVAAGGQFERDRALAALMTAEILHRSGDGPGMMSALRALPSGFVHAHPDLAPLVSLATGSALRLLKDERAAILHLRVAVRSLDPALKGGACFAIAECFAALDQPVPAWTAVREAEALEKHDAALRRIRTRRSEIEESMGALGRAIETCLLVLNHAPGPFDGADRVLATLARCLLATDKVEDARAALEILADHGSYRGWALYQLARLDRRAGDAERALRALSRLRPGDLVPPGPSPALVRTLRGELLLDLGDPLQAAEVFRGAQEEPLK
jgi:tetratricopeptide (TPR) repeat protein